MKQNSNLYLYLYLSFSCGYNKIEYTPDYFYINYILINRLSFFNIAFVILGR